MPGLEIVPTGMGFFEWTASLAGSLAWPIAAVVIASRFRTEIGSLLSKLKKITWGDKSADFSNELDEIEKRVEAQPAVEEQPITDAAPALSSRFSDLLKISPSAATLDAWSPIERRLRELRRRSSVRVTMSPSSGGSHRQPTRRIIEDLHQNSLISGNTYELLIELQNLRNRAAHNEDVSVADAYRFNSLAETALQGIPEQIM